MNKTQVTLSLISHTNVGKTTLARTLLRREVGEVFDQSHVTDLSEEFTLVETRTGAALKLWDTPGFGDSFRLWKRLKQSENAIIGFLTRAWDRFTDRPFWCSQQAILNVRDHAEVVLYLANAAEDPAEAAYIEPELDILQWLGKPIIVLLNQMGPPREKALEEREVNRWRKHFERISHPCEVMVFDAFARCWVQEEVLWRTIRGTLAGSSHPVFDECVEHWRKINVDVFHRSMQRLGVAMTKVITDREVLPPQTMAEKILSPVAEAFRGPQKDAMSRLGKRMVTEISTAVDDIIKYHELSGEAARLIESRFEDDFAVNQPLNKGIAATIGGFLTGALTGLAADLAAGGLTFGGGALIGGILGATGGVLAAESYNFIKGGKEAFVAWSPRFIRGMVESIVLRYLAVAHFGRGRGQWTEAEHPRFWIDTVSSVTQSLDERIGSEMEQIRRARPRIDDEFKFLLSDATTESLLRLYPDAIPGKLLAMRRKAERLTESGD